MAAGVLVGTSGFSYDDWRGAFYPRELPRAKWLGFYAGKFATVEMNSPFYRLPAEKVWANWRDAVPQGFVFAVKASRFITHIKRLNNAEEPVKTFTSHARILGEKLGPLLYQLPPGTHRNVNRLEAFLGILPGDLKHVFEFRHASWLDDSVYQTLHKHNAGFCIYDMPEFTTPVFATADFAYVRFHGSEGLYSSSYPDEALAGWAKKLAKLAAGLKELYVYFNNDVSAYAVSNAVTLRGYLEREVGLK